MRCFSVHGSIQFHGAIIISGRATNKRCSTVHDSMHIQFHGAIIIIPGRATSIRGVPLYMAPFNFMEL